MMIHIYYNCKPFLFSSNLTKTLMKPLAERPPVYYFLNLSVLFNYSVIVQSGWLSILLDPLNLAPSLSLSPLSLSLSFSLQRHKELIRDRIFWDIYIERESHKFIRDSGQIFSGQFFGHLFPGFRGVVFGGGITPDPIAPGVTPDLSARPYFQAPQDYRKCF